MLLAFCAIVMGLVLLVWSADRFVSGAASTATYFGMPPLLIGIVIVGLGTSAPEIVVSLLATMQGNPGIAIGNAYGSNISNASLILGITALISPLLVPKQVVHKELPMLLGVTALTGFILSDYEISRFDSWILLSIFMLFMTFSVWQARRNRHSQEDDSPSEEDMPLMKALFWLIVGLGLLIASSRLLVWGAVYIAKSLGVSDLIIGLTIVAVGTSLPELASSIIAARKKQYDLVIGNIIGSNMFNTLVVVGIAGVINPIPIAPEVLSRDFTMMMALTFLVFFMALKIGKKRVIGRIKGALLLSCYIGYTFYLVQSVFA